MSKDACFLRWSFTTTGCISSEMRESRVYRSSMHLTLKRSICNSGTETLVLAAQCRVGRKYVRRPRASIFGQLPCLSRRGGSVASSRVAALMSLQCSVSATPQLNESSITSVASTAKELQPLISSASKNSCVGLGGLAGKETSMKILLRLQVRR